MPVAPSFQSMPIEGEPFTSNGKQYVKVKNEKTGKLRTVRWYSENEYAKLYPSASKEKANDPYYKPQKEVLGFGEKGYIIAFKGDSYPHKEYLKEKGCRYTRWWGWYCLEEEVPFEVPVGLEPIKLYWEPMAKNTEWLKSDEEIKKYVDSVIYEPTESEYVGEIGERLDLYITIEKVIKFDNDYGHSTMYLMRDDCGNAFVWNTSSVKDWKEGEERHIRGTVKAFKEFRHDKQTVLSRCSEVK